MSERYEVRRDLQPPRHWEVVDTQTRKVVGHWPYAPKAHEEARQRNAHAAIAGKAKAWQYALRRGFLTPPQVKDALDYADLDVDAEVARLGPDDVVVVRMDELPDNERLEDLRDALRRAFPGQQILVTAAGTQIAAGALADFLAPIPVNRIAEALSRHGITIELTKGAR